MNQVSIIGNIGKEVKVRFTASGQAVSSFSVGINKTYRDRGGQDRKQTVWANVTAWGKLAEAAGNLQKGEYVFVQGRLNTRSYEDEAGQTKYVTEVVAYLIARPLSTKQTDKADFAQYGTVVPAYDQEPIPF